MAVWEEKCPDNEDCYATELEYCKEKDCDLDCKRESEKEIFKSPILGMKRWLSV